MIHAVKQLPDYFNDVISGKKTFEVRKNDRPYAVDDKVTHWMPLPEPPKGE